MKELSIEEKAQRYDEAIKVAADIKAGTATYIKDGTLVVDAIFPELKESEDERIRKSLLDYLRTLPNHFSHNGSFVIDWIAWLEKQGEQKPNPCDGCINRKGCINCENGELREVEQKSAWSEEDERIIDNIIFELEENQENISGVGYKIDWLQSLKNRHTWKPSEEMLQALYRVIPENTMEISEDEILLDKLYQGLKYGRVL